MTQDREMFACSDERITALTQTDERVRRVQGIPNVGPVTAAAFVPAIGANRWPRGRARCDNGIDPVFDHREGWR